MVNALGLLYADENTELGKNEESPTTTTATTTAATTKAPTTTAATTKAPTTTAATTKAPTTTVATTKATTTTAATTKETTRPATTKVPTTTTATTKAPTTTSATSKTPTTTATTKASTTTQSSTTAAPTTTTKTTTSVTPTKTEDKMRSLANDLSQSQPSESSVIAAENWVFAHPSIPEDASDPQTYAEDFLSLCSNLVHSNHKSHWNKDNGGASKVADSCSSVVDDLARISDTDTTLETPTIVARTKSFPVASDVEDVDVELTNSTSVSISKEEIDRLGIEDGQKISVSMMTYKNGDLITGRSHKSDTEDKSPVSEVVAISFYTGNVKTSIPVSFTLTIDTSTTEEEKGEEPTCVYLKTDENGLVTWDTDGCEVTESTDTEVACHCTHTTNFAILMQVKEVKISRRDELALEWITNVCCTLSIIALLVTFVVLLALRSLLRSERVIIHVNLVIALMVAQTLLLVSGPAATSQSVCRAVAIMLHYFFTAVFCWMLIEGVHLYLQIVRVFGSGRSKLIPYMAIGWGLPFLIVLITASARWHGYGANGRCWLSTDHGMIWAFVAPALAVIAVNCVILVMVLRVLVIAAKSKSDGELEHIKAGLKGAILLLPLLGITWIFGVISVNAHTVVFLYLFALFNSLQGVFIFLLYCVFNAEVRKAFTRQKEKRALTRGDMISTIDSMEDSKSRSKANRVYPENETKDTEMVDIKSTVTTTTHTQMVIRRQPTSEGGMKKTGVKSISEVD